MVSKSFSIYSRRGMKDHMHDVDRRMGRDKVKLKAYSLALNDEDDPVAAAKRRREERIRARTEALYEGQNPNGVGGTRRAPVAGRRVSLKAVLSAGGADQTQAVVQEEEQDSLATTRRVRRQPSMHSVQEEENVMGYADQHQSPPRVRNEASMGNYVPGLPQVTYQTQSTHSQDPALHMQMYNTHPPQHVQHMQQMPQMQQPPQHQYQYPAHGGGNAQPYNHNDHDQQEYNRLARKSSQELAHRGQDEMAPEVLRHREVSKREAFIRGLEMQIAEKNERKAREAEKLRQEDIRKDAEIATYNPWGRPGCGAPLRDGNGEAVADLRFSDYTNVRVSNNAAHRFNTNTSPPRAMQYPQNYQTHQQFQAAPSQVDPANQIQVPMRQTQYNTHPPPRHQQSQYQNGEQYVPAMHQTQKEVRHGRRGNNDPYMGNPGTTQNIYHGFKNTNEPDHHQGLFMAALSGLHGGPSDQERLEQEAKRKKFIAALDEQVREKQERKAREEAQRRARELKEEQEMMAYNPFGAPGGGAPMRHPLDEPVQQPVRYMPHAQPNMDKYTPPSAAEVLKSPPQPPRQMVHMNPAPQEEPEESLMGLVNGTSQGQRYDSPGYQAAAEQRSRENVRVLDEQGASGYKAYRAQVKAIDDRLEALEAVVEKKGRGRGEPPSSRMKRSMNNRDQSYGSRGAGGGSRGTGGGSRGTDTKGSRGRARTRGSNSGAGNKRAGERSPVEEELLFLCRELREEQRIIRQRMQEHESALVGLIRKGSEEDSSLLGLSAGAAQVASANVHEIREGVLAEVSGEVGRRTPDGENGDSHHKNYLPSPFRTKKVGGNRVGNWNADQIPGLSN